MDAIIDELAGTGALKPEFEPKPEPKPARAVGRIKEAKEQKIQKTFFSDGTYLYEEIVSQNIPSFVRFDIESGEYKVIQAVDDIVPQIGEELEYGAVLLPSGVKEYSDTVTLLNKPRSTEIIS